MRLALTALTFASLAFAAPAMAQDATGDAAAGERVFNKCQTCHVIADADGTVLGGRNAKTGPNLYGLPGRAAGTYEGFNGYGDSLVALGASGFVWDEASFVEYVADPAKFLKAKLDNSARSKMSFKLGNAKEQADVWAYIASLSPAVEVDAEAEGDEAPAATY
ncbi:MAG: c-type cytochrome [Pseudotabrizicola sp.]|uniref:c-type cytochrome n=1 Tax=Pseudotabrizicola sp. TaxID=2939647 RepID=UPI002721D32B|nr:c-type cytochrome [Pseudotabrizicola sp.]MDO8884405.1 c-type cytochrome [Pseudotabrizicola sp.]MDP2081491.1 c-type cytochrome [Pseudotabrizicola sp.]MDZ7573004.1 c-type cytochrome [Pseudotabrizicola sp.]